MTSTTIMRPLKLDPMLDISQSKKLTSRETMYGSQPMAKATTLDEDYFERRTLRLICTQKFPWDDSDFPPQASLVVPGLYLSDMYTATCPLALKRLGITHVVSVIRDPYYRYPKGVRNICVPVDDMGTADLARYLEWTVAWIRRALLGTDFTDPDSQRAGGRVLVHCMWGMSRSATVVLAYLMKERAMSLQNAIAFLKRKRKVVNPNRGFILQLMCYEERMKQIERQLEWRAAALRSPS